MFCFPYRFLSPTINKISTWWWKSYLPFLSHKPLFLIIKKKYFHRKGYRIYAICLSHSFSLSLSLPLSLSLSPSLSLSLYLSLSLILLQSLCDWRSLNNKNGFEKNLLQIRFLPKNLLLTSSIVRFSQITIVSMCLSDYYEGKKACLRNVRSMMHTVEHGIVEKKEIVVVITIMIILKIIIIRILTWMGIRMGVYVLQLAKLEFEFGLNSINSNQLE